MGDENPDYVSSDVQKGKTETSKPLTKFDLVFFNLVSSLIVFGIINLVCLFVAESVNINAQETINLIGLISGHVANALTLIVSPIYVYRIFFIEDK